MTDKPELKHCPFCSSTVKMSEHLHSTVPSEFSITCHNCGLTFCGGLDFADEDEFTEAWNQRADLAKPSEWISAVNKIHAKVKKLEWKQKGHHCDAGKACQAIADIIKALPTPPRETP